MNNELTILLVEDDQQSCSKIIEYIDTFDDIRLIGVTNNASKAIEIVKDCHPKAIILDLELHQGSGSGLDILQGIKSLMLPVSPYILVTTNNSSTVTYEFARQLGADYILFKHQEGYSEKTAVDFLHMLKGIILSKWKFSSQESLTTESPHQKNQRITRRIYTELNNVGISQRVVGYKYLVDGILLIIDHPQQHICNTIGQKYGKTEASVERAMQSAINKAWRTTDIDELATHFTAKVHSEKGVPTLTEFVYYYANKIKAEY
ncbi:MAG: response regulator [Oscillospiraceae bacterium]|nr:response regulator [Oscillospiraceae bacterium]